MALPSLLAAPSAFGAVTVIENVSITATTQTSGQWLEIDAQSPGTFIIEHDPDVDFAAGNYTISVKSRVNDSIPDKGLGVRFDSIAGSDGNNEFLTSSDYANITLNNWFTYSMDFTMDATGDNDGRLEFRMENFAGTGNLGIILIDDFSIVRTDVVETIYFNDFESDTPGQAPSRVSISGIGAGGSASIAPVPEPSSAMLLGLVGLLGLVRRRR